MTTLLTSTRIFYDERAKAMAELFDLQSEELAQAGWRNTAIGVILTLLFHLADALLGSRLANKYKILPAGIGKVKNDRQSTSQIHNSL
jgi:hypothetical protein